jgi:capsular polysaccharide export protein
MTFAPQPLLRAPPFPGRTVTVASLAPDSPARDGADDLPDPQTLFAPIRAEQVGGAFWAEPANLTAPPAVIVRPARRGDPAAMAASLDPADRAGALWVPVDPEDRALAAEAARCGAVHATPVDPWSVLPDAGLLVAHGDDEWVALARIAGVAVRIHSAGQFGTPEDSAATLDTAVARHLAASRYTDPFTGAAATLGEIAAVLGLWRRLIAANRTIAAACGMAWWKRDEIRRFLWVPERTLQFARTAAHALRLARKAGGAVAIWPSRVSPALLEQAGRQNTALVRVEDGFVRSVGLGSNLVPPSSVVVDRAGIHFDPAGPSDLETILATTDFTPAMRARAQTLCRTIIAAGISKYAAGPAADVAVRQSANRRLVLVPAQVEDDMSVLAGGGGLHSNLELLRRARALEPDAEIWFRPHPDVDAGHRKGAVPDADALRYADRIVRGGGMAALLDQVDAVHVLTSLTGFEALIRGLDVTCHGTPFYAGWGLTRDLGTVPDRRGRRLDVDELAAGVLILYPRYLDPVTSLPCPPEVLIRRMAQADAPNRLGWVAPLRRWQGRFMARWR